ncbi:zinc finger CCCH domain-containing protein 32-like isoform X1 [Solanum stenotomum]|uniref:zinc finger CCCH domain-containing protein 32-like isoform X1 n=1 Tax=Solanum stenotomum TaxID=172797 RepID=UPI0020D12E90|nr:zinc finger CCCH domain-containing protein 32-like isoform X1 [Solanum stenotomum]XP_049407745.1 zinc finger CCCH domain-containing protein 32-like isoform X1 [Solanum stenotomum]XP_049407746.1 zinc finger CCCH domain-containing protein 32-like isoform X1 [Solanum stenotomum]
MELYGPSTGSNGSQSDHQSEWVAVEQETGLDGSMQKLGLFGREVYPERPDVPDCSYYLRNGSCGYGPNCRFNHPSDRDRRSGGKMQLEGVEFPERTGEPICQYFLRTGTCKFGVSCKFHHPRNFGGTLSNIPLNTYGYPLRTGEIECTYYLKTGHCKFGITCKFHHPQPAGISVPAPARPFYPTVQSLPAPPEECNSALTGLRVARPPILPGSYVPSAYGPVLLHPGVVTIQNWSPYSGPVSPALSPGVHPSAGLTSVYGMSPLASSPHAFAGPYSPLPPAASPSSKTQKEKSFPERPGQSICQYYVKTGDCKFGSSCKFHHPPDWIASKTNCAISPMGLPLRPGVQPCSFYLLKGFCKFGSACKFDHPMGTVQYSSSASSLPDLQVAPYMLRSSFTLAPMLLPELQAGFVTGSKVDVSLSRAPSSMKVQLVQLT